MTNKKKLETYLAALGVLSVTMMKDVMREVRRAREENEEKEKDGDGELLAVAILAAVPKLRKKFQNDVKKFLEEFCIEEIFQEFHLKREKYEEVVTTIEESIRIMPAGAAHKAKTLASDFKKKSPGAAMEKFAGHGIPGVEYEGGDWISAEGYARGAANDLLHHHILEEEAREREERGIRTVYAKPRREACMKCIPWLGIVMIDDVFSYEPLPEDLGYPLLSEAVEAGFLHPNCKDTIRTYTEDMANDVRPMTDDEIKAAEKAYQKSQRINQIKRYVKKYDILRESGEPKYEQLHKKWQQELKRLEG